MNEDNAARGLFAVTVLALRYSFILQFQIRGAKTKAWLCGLIQVDAIHLFDQVDMRGATLQSAEKRMEWFTLDASSSYTERSEETWIRTIGIDELTGEAHVCCAVAGDEHALSVYALKQGQTVTISNGHTYVEAKWLISAFPFSRDTLRKLLGGSGTSRHALRAS